MLTQAQSAPIQTTAGRLGRNWVGAVLLIAALAALPLVAPSYWIYFAGLLGINIIATHGLNIMTGYTGLLSLGHAAFVGVGAYTVALAQLHLGLPFYLAIPLAGIASAVIGTGFGLPSLRIRGLYLVIATLAAQFILNFAPPLLVGPPVPPGLASARANTPTANPTRPTAATADAASTERATTTPCGMISQATRGRVPDALGRKFIVAAV